MSKRVKIGVSFREDLIQLVDGHVTALRELGVDRSEVVNAVLSEFLESKSTTEDVLETVAAMRARRRSEGSPISFGQGETLVLSSVSGGRAE